MSEREASPKQKALLRFVGMPFQEPLSSAEASRLIDEVIESDSYRERLDQWNRAKLKLHVIRE
jgi:ABC-type dipeptide/oligopeptide/nickel transport system ATPase subunit